MNRTALIIIGVILAIIVVWVLATSGEQMDGTNNTPTTTDEVPQAPPGTGPTDAPAGGTPAPAPAP